MSRARYKSKLRSTPAVHVEEKNNEIPLVLVTTSPVKDAKDVSLHIESAISKSHRPLTKEELAKYTFNQAQMAVDEWLNSIFDSVKDRHTIEAVPKWGNKLTDGKTRSMGKGIHNLGLIIGHDYFITSIQVANYRADYDPLKGKHFNIEICSSIESKAVHTNPVKAGKYVFAFGDHKSDQELVVSVSKKRTVMKQQGSLQLMKFLAHKTKSSLHEMPSSVYCLLERNYEIAKMAMLTSAVDNLDHLLDYFCILHADCEILTVMLKQSGKPSKQGVFKPPAIADQRSEVKEEKKQKAEAPKKTHS